VPERVGAQCCGVPTGVSFGGVDPRSGRNFVFYEGYCGGMGGSLALDGADAVSTGTANQMNIPVESVEMDYPIRMLRYELRPDSGGSGRFRGGLGLLREYEMLAESSSVNVRGDRALFAPKGFHGGGDGAKADLSLERADGRVERIPSKFSGRMARGDRLIVKTPGGGGFGPPAERARASLARDLLDGKVSERKTREDYGVNVETLRSNGSGG
jgi:N-methylhydantoinase B